MGSASSLTPSRLLLLAALLACGVVAPLLSRRLSVAAHRAAHLHRLRARLGPGRRADGLQLLRQRAVRRRSACMSAAIVQVGLFYDVGLYTEAKGGGTEFVFDAGAVPHRARARPAGRGARRARLPPGMLGSLVLSMRGHYFAICTLGLGIAAGQVAAGIPWIGAGSGMLTPNPPADLGDVGLLLYYLALGLAVRLHAHLRLAPLDPLRARAERHPGRRGQGRGDGPHDPRRQGDGLDDRRRVPRRGRRASTAISCASSIPSRRPSPGRPSACG